MNIYFEQTTLGKIGIAEENGQITNVYLPNDPPPQNASLTQNPVLQEAFRQLNAYLTGKLQDFSLPLSPSGTDFMKQVWQALCKIPYGKTASYKEIAVAIGKNKAVRAVGLANSKNPIPIFIPCHRIIGASGKLVGYRGGIEIKEKLLAIEKKNLAETKI